MQFHREQHLLRRVEHSGQGWHAVLDIDSVNRRVKVKSYRFDHRDGLAALGEHLLSLAREEGCGKVLAEVREGEWEQFLGRGFTLEGLIPGYFAGEPAYCLSYFVDPKRQASSRLERDNAIREQVLSLDPVHDRVLDPRFTIHVPSPDDADEMANLYRKVFTTYPTPLNDAAFIRDVMVREASIFRLVRDGGRLVSAASAEVDWVSLHAEMTDCATLPDYRGEGLMAALLKELEQEMVKRGIHCRYSHARAASPGMNAVLRRLGYRLRGRMVNNCHIMGSFEDMNLWVKI
ncbi:MAG TPA: putative beta-lysine N-acetyltransferase [Symbiobacteriaceae bacterium]|nr:putative beta-lysine N-acetyltransferase [Symbiobacteriaceae bacterium]